MTSSGEIAIPLRFMVTVDTEADDAWSSPDKIRLRNIRQLPRFQDLCDEYGVVPTYLVAYECATRDDALSILKPLSDSRQCEIGHHLHVWTTPPYQNGDMHGIDRDWIHAFQFQLPDSLFFEKSERLRAAIEASFGRSPTSHRAGRWGIDQRTVDWLISAGFVVETSIRTGFPLSRQQVGKTTERLSDEPIACMTYELRQDPYFWTGSDQCGNSGAIVEIPLTTSVPGGLVSWIYRHLLKPGGQFEPILLKVIRKLGGRRMLRPDPSYPPGQLPRIMNLAIRQGVTVINLMLHSSELALHCSPFTRTQNDLDCIWAHLREVFQFARSLEIESACVSDVGRLIRTYA